MIRNKKVWDSEIECWVTFHTESLPVLADDCVTGSQWRCYEHPDKDKLYKMLSTPQFSTSHRREVYATMTRQKLAHSKVLAPATYGMVHFVHQEKDLWGYVSEKVDCGGLVVLSDRQEDYEDARAEYEENPGGKRDLMAAIKALKDMEIPAEQIEAWLGPYRRNEYVGIEDWVDGEIVDPEDLSEKLRRIDLSPYRDDENKPYGNKRMGDDLHADNLGFNQYGNLICVDFGFGCVS